MSFLKLFNHIRLLQGIPLTFLGLHKDLNQGLCLVAKPYLGHHGVSSALLQRRDSEISVYEDIHRMTSLDSDYRDDLPATLHGLRKRRDSLGVVDPGMFIAEFYQADLYFLDLCMFHLHRPKALTTI